MLKRFLSMLLCLALLCGAALAEGVELELVAGAGVELDLSEDVGAVEDGLKLNLAEDTELTLPELEQDEGISVQANPSANEGEEAETPVKRLNNETVASLSFNEKDTDYTLIVEGECTVDSGIWSIENGSTLTITGGGKLTVNGIIVTKKRLVIDGVTLISGSISAHDEVIIRNSTVEAPGPSLADADYSIQNGESSSDYTASLTIVNSTIKASCSVGSEGMLSIVDSSVDVTWSDMGGIGAPNSNVLIDHSRVRVVTENGEEIWPDLIYAREGLILKNVHCVMKRTTSDPYEDLPLTSLGGDVYKPGHFSSVEWLITPVEPLPKIESISIDNGGLGKNPKLLVGAKATFKAKVSPKKADAKAIKWSVNNTKYASITQEGVLTAKAKGAGKTVTVTAKATDGSGKSASVKVRIIGKVTKITLKPSAKTVKAGKKVTIKATVKAQSGANKALKWQVSNTKYATISQKGVLTAKKAGKGKTVTVTATAKDGSGTKASLKIKIV
jgi:hypothetical protein